MVNLPLMEAGILEDKGHRAPGLKAVGRSWVYPDGTREPWGSLGYSSGCQTGEGCKGTGKLGNAGSLVLGSRVGVVAAMLEGSQSCLSQVIQVSRKHSRNPAMKKSGVSHGPGQLAPKSQQTAPPPKGALTTFRDSETL